MVSTRVTISHFLSSHTSINSSSFRSWSMVPVRAPNCLVFHEPTLQRRLACLRLTNRPTHLPCPIRFLRCSCLIFFLATLSKTDDLVMGKSKPVVQWSGKTDTWRRLGTGWLLYDNKPLNAAWLRARNRLICVVSCCHDCNAYASRGWST